MKMIQFDGYELTENQYNLYILKKHLIRYTGDILKANMLIEKHKKNLFGKNGLAVALGEHDFEFYCLYFLQDTFIPKEDNTARNLAPVHLEIWEELSKIFIDDLYDKEEFVLPRGCSKSTIINKALSCYAHCYKKSRYTIVIGNKESDATQFIDDTKQMLSNKYIIQGFGVLVNRKERTVNKIELELTNDTKIQAFSWGSSVRGTTYGCIDGIFRPSLVICDDILSEDDILSDGAKEKVIKKYYTEIAEVGDTEVIRNGIKIKAATKFIIIGTPLAPDCFINTIRQDSTFKVFKRSVCDFDVDEYFENNQCWLHYKKILLNDKIDKEEKEILLKEYYSKHKGEMEFKTIWEKYQCDKLAQKYFTKRTAFMQELMCSTEKIGEKWFRSMRTQSKEQIEDNYFLKTMLCADPASTITRTSDSTALCVGSLANNGFKYVRKGILAKLGFEEYCQKVVELFKEYTQVTHIYIEKNTFQGADVIRIKEIMYADPALRNRPVTFINEMQRKNKDNKISAMVDDVNSGQVIFNEDDKDFNQQVLDFAGQLYSLHDDAPDVTSEFWKRIDEIEVKPSFSITTWDELYD